MKTPLSRLSLMHEQGIVLDPFVGSGTTAVAAYQLDRQFIGIDISEKYCRIARHHLNKT